MSESNISKCFFSNYVYCKEFCLTPRAITLGNCFYQTRNLNTYYKALGLYQHTSYFIFFTFYIQKGKGIVVKVHLSHSGQVSGLSIERNLMKIMLVLIPKQSIILIFTQCEYISS